MYKSQLYDKVNVNGALIIAPKGVVVTWYNLSHIHISEPMRLTRITYAEISLKQICRLLLEKKMRQPETDSDLQKTKNTNHM